MRMGGSLTTATRLVQAQPSEDNCDRCTVVRIDWPTVQNLFASLTSRSKLTSQDVFYGLLVQRCDLHPMIITIYYLNPVFCRSGRFILSAMLVPVFLPSLAPRPLVLAATRRLLPILKCSCPFRTCLGLRGVRKSYALGHRVSGKAIPLVLRPP